MSLIAWKYYSEITISNPNSTALIDYQVRIDLDSSNFDFSKANSDGSDIRFSEDNGNTTIPYWIESWDSSGQTATIWIKISSIDANSDKIIRMYFGNLTATSESNIVDTAVNELGDDFNGTSLDTNKWTAIKEGSASAIVELDGSGNLHLAGEDSVTSSGNVVSKNTIVNNIIIRVRRKYTNEYYVDTSIGNGVLQDIDGGQSDWWHTTQGDGYLFIQHALNNHYISITPSGAARSDVVSDATNSYGAINTFETDEFVYDSSGNLKWILNGTTILSGTDTTYLSSDKYVGLHQGEYSNGNGGDSYYDWIFVREYTDTEPTYTIGSTQIATWGDIVWFGANF
jgi:hypothetical protein